MSTPRFTNALDDKTLLFWRSQIEAAEKWSKKAIQERIDPVLAIEEGLGKGLKIIGDAFHRQEAFIPELIMAAETMKAGQAILHCEPVRSMSIREQACNPHTASRNTVNRSTDN